jgi:uncharacterized protein
MKICVTGGTGFIGRVLVGRLIADGHTVTILDRTIKAVPFAATAHQIDLTNGRIKPEWLDGIDVLVHLAGAPIAGKLWTKDYKREIIDSRVKSATNLLEAMALLPAQRRPKVIVSASAIGYYGSCGDKVLTETSPSGADFLSQVCREWEGVWDGVRTDARVVSVRTGIVISERGGIVAMLRPSTKLGLGAVLGSGEQWVSWIGINDLVSVYMRAIADDKMAGAYNAVAPQPLRNADFTKRLAAQYGRPVFLRAPAWVLQLALGAGSQVVLGSQRVKPKALDEAGFAFRCLTISQALADTAMDT